MAATKLAVEPLLSFITKVGQQVASWHCWLNGSGHVFSRFSEVQCGASWAFHSRHLARPCQPISFPRIVFRSPRHAWLHSRRAAPPSLCASRWAVAVGGHLCTAASHLLSLRPAHWDTCCCLPITRCAALLAIPPFTAHPTPSPSLPQAFAAPDRVAELVGRVREALGAALPEAVGAMRLYLPNPATHAILFKPIKSNVAEAHGQVSTNG